MDIDELKAENERLKKELQAEKLVWAIKEGQIRDNFQRCKSAAEYWKDKYQEVCKCKDCQFCGQRQCMRN